VEARPTARADDQPIHIRRPAAIRRRCLVAEWFAFGEFDGVFLMEAPDNASAATVAMAVGDSGTLSEVETTVLLDMDEAQDAMQKAAQQRTGRQVQRHGCPVDRRNRQRREHS
jgi:hypothetical protein